jgi:hypothetical protein
MEKKHRKIIGIIGISLIGFILLSLPVSCLSNPNMDELVISIQEETEEDGRFSFFIMDWIDFILENLGLAAILVCLGLLLVILLVLRAYTLATRPIVGVNSGKSYGFKKLGRLVDCIPCDRKQLSLFWEYRFKELDEYDREFKKSKDYSLYYCRENFETMRKYRFRKWDFGLWRYEEFAHYFIQEWELPPNLHFREQILKRSLENRVKYILFRILNAFFLFTFARWVHNSLEYEESDKIVKKIKVLQFEY